MSSFMKVVQIAPPVKPSDWLAASLQITNTKLIDLANALDVRPNVVSVWKNGKQDIPSTRLAQMARIFGADLMYVRNLKYNTEEWQTWEYDEKVRQLGSLTQNELEFLELIRSCGKVNPKMNEEQKERFKKFLEELDDGLSCQEFNKKVK